MIQNSKEDLDLLNSLTEKLVNDMQNKVAIKTDIGIMQDIKRMADLGCFTVYRTDEMPDINFDGLNISTTIYMPRIMWEGENEIKRLRAENERLKNCTITDHATTENTIKKIQSLYNEKRSVNDMIARFKRNLLKMEEENECDPLKPFLPIQIEKCKFLIEDFTNDIEGLDKEIVELIKGIEV